MQHILIIGGDARYLEVIQALSEKGHSVYLIGYEKLSFTHPSITQTNHAEVDLSTMDAIILPVQGPGEDGSVSSTYSEMDLSLTKEMMDQTPNHCTIFTGRTNDFLNEAATDRRIEVIFSRDDVAIYNAIPTAEATLQLAIEQTDRTIHSAKTLVLGFGRVGLTVARLFKNVGAEVAVGVRSETDAARITEMGMQPVAIPELGKTIHQQHICINTIPHLVLDKALIAAMDPSTLIIDLASVPGGTDFDYAKGREMTVIHALGLPGKTAPKTAGKIIAQTILSLVD